MQHCPNCRARYRDGSACRRCGMELKRLISIENTSDQFLQAGIEALAADDQHTASAHLLRAYQLTHDPLAKALWGFCHCEIRCENGNIP